MEANDHAFSHEARNWGWAQYWRRNDAYYSNPSAKYNDAFLICCTIVYSPTPPAPQHTSQTLKKPIPMDLLDAYSSLFNDPLYSDICFKIIRRRRRHDDADQKCKPNVVRRLYASKKILIRRSEYFSTMFDSGFAESSVVLSNDSCDEPRPQRDLGHSDRFGFVEEGEDADEDDLMEEDSDDCDDEDHDAVAKNEDSGDDGSQEDSMLKEEEPQYYESGVDEVIRDSGDHILTRPPENVTRTACMSHDKVLESDASGDKSFNILTSDEMAEESAHSPDYGGVVDNHPEAPNESSAPYIALDPHASLVINSNANLGGPSSMNLTPSNVNINHHPYPSRPNQDQRASAKSIHSKCSTDFSPSKNIHQDTSANVKSKTARKPTNLRSPKKMTVIEVTDAAYTTFKALLFFLYTDSISFAPLSSTYHCLRDEAQETGVPFSYASRKAYVNAMVAKATFIGNGGQSLPGGPIVDPSIVCSAKAVYRLADKLNLIELKSRAFEHITRSLTVQNIPMEVFSSFTSAYEEIRKIEVNYMLAHWNEVRDGRSIKKVLKMLSDGGKVCSGFSEIWSVLLSNLEFKPKPIDSNPSPGGPPPSSQHHQQNDSSQDPNMSGANASAAGGMGVQSREAVELLWNPNERVIQGASN